MPPLIKQTVAGAVVNNRNIATDLTANIVNGILFKANQLYNYGKSGSYPWGLPDGSMAYISDTGQQSCKTVLEAIEGGPVCILGVLIEPDGNGDYIYTVNYHLVDTQGNITGDMKTWEYNEGAETYPTLTIDKLSEESPYYPIIPIRLDNVNLAEEIGAEYYAEIKKACNYLSIDLQSLYDDINSQDTDNPPEDMYILMGVSISNNTPRTNEYLYRYFESMYGSSVVTKVEYDYWGNTTDKTTQAPQNTVVIKDSQFHSELSWSYITSTVENKTGTSGTYTVEYVSNAGRVDHGDWVESTDGVRVSWQRNGTQRITFLVHGLVYRSKVAGDHWVSKDCMNAFGDPDDPENGEVFIVPLRKDICVAMGAIKAHDLMYESIRLHVNDEYSYKVKWYQTGFGQLFVLVVAIAVSVIFQQWQTLSWATAAATAGLVLQQVIIAMVLQPVMAILVQDVLGEELALLVTAIMMAYGMSVGMDAATGSLVVSTAPSIASVATASMQLYTGLKSLDFQEDMEDLAKEQEAVQELLKDQAEEEMQTAIDVNMVSNMISNDPYHLMEPSSFVQRMLDEGKEPLLINKVAQNYTRVATYTDKPSSMIRLDVY